MYMYELANVLQCIHVIVIMRKTRYTVACLCVCVCVCVCRLLQLLKDQ